VAFGPIDGSLGFGLSKCTITKEKLSEAIQEILAADIDLCFLLKLNEFKRQTLVTTIRERIDRRSGSAAMIWATRNSFFRSFTQQTTIPRHAHEYLDIMDFQW